MKIHSTQSGFNVIARLENNTVSLPQSSPFLNWKEARRYAGPLPFTFSYNAETNNVLIIEGVRENWAPKPIEVLDYHFSFLQQMQLGQICLANAFIIKDVPYYWKKGKLEKWQG